VTVIAARTRDEDDRRQTDKDIVEASGWPQTATDAMTVEDKIVAR